MKLDASLKVECIFRSVLMLVLFVSCRTSPKSASSEKPVIPKFKMAIEYNFSKGFPYIWDSKIESNHFIISDASTDRGNALDVNLDNCSSRWITQVKSYSINYWMNRDTKQYNYINSKMSNDTVEIQLQGKKESYKIYSFSEGWSPVPNTIRSGELESFSGNIKIIQHKNGVQKTIITQNIKNYLTDKINDKVLFVGNFKYLVYLDGEKGGMGRVYVIEL